MVSLERFKQWDLLLSLSFCWWNIHASLVSSGDPERELQSKLVVCLFALEELTSSSLHISSSLKGFSSSSESCDSACTEVCIWWFSLALCFVTEDSSIPQCLLKYPILVVEMVFEFCEKIDKWQKPDSWI